MELLYIWIDNYKNINRQGFNFSPKYRFEFTPTTNEKDEVTGGDLTCTENDFPDNFFCEGISNVTAIVGENGSGKSNLLELIMFAKTPAIIFHKMIYVIDDIIYYSKHFKINLNQESTQKFTTKQYNTGSAKSDKTVDGVLEHKRFLYYTPAFQFRNMEEDTFYLSPINNLSTILFMQRGIKSYYLDELLRQINFIFNFKSKIPFELPTHLFMTVPAKLQEQVVGIADVEIQKEIMSKYVQFIEDKETLTFRKIINFSTFIIYLALLNEHEKVSEAVKLMNTYKFDDEKFSISPLKQTGNILSLIEESKNFNQAYTKLFIDNKEIKIKLDINYLSDKHLEYQLFHSILKIQNVYHLAQVEGGFNIINFEWSYYLSSGQEFYLQLFSRLLARYNDPYISELVIIDEGELGLHPQWQKEYLKNLIDVLPKIFEGKKIQIILTSHSPFLVSDLPKENVIFLRKGEKEDGELENKCMVVKEGDRKHPKVTQTFGQNIHTLFADSFFMEGTIGEFAKTKILELVDFLVGKENAKIFTQEEAKQLVLMVGENLIQNKLANLYQRKFGDSPFETLDEKEARLQKELKEVQERKNK